MNIPKSNQEVLPSCLQLSRFVTSEMAERAVELQKSLAPVARLSSARSCLVWEEVDDDHGNSHPSGPEQSRSRLSFIPFELCSFMRMS